MSLIKSIRFYISWIKGTDADAVCRVFVGIGHHIPLLATFECFHVKVVRNIGMWRLDSKSSLLSLLVALGRVFFIITGNHEFCMQRDFFLQR